MANAKAIVAESTLEGHAAITEAYLAESIKRMDSAYSIVRLLASDYVERDEEFKEGPHFNLPAGCVVEVLNGVQRLLSESQDSARMALQRLRKGDGKK